MFTTRRIKRKYKQLFHEHVNVPDHLEEIKHHLEFKANPKKNRLIPLLFISSQALLTFMIFIQHFKPASKSIITDEVGNPIHKTQDNTLVYILVSLLVISIILGILYYLFKKKNN